MMILESVILRSLFRLTALLLYFRHENTVRHETKQSAITDCFVFAHKTNGEHGSPLQITHYFHLLKTFLLNKKFHQDGRPMNAPTGFDFKLT